MQLCVRSPGVDETSVDGRVVLYHRGTNVSAVLNRTGSWLWKQLSEPAGPDALGELLQRQHPTVPSDQVRRDIATYLDQLAKLSMISVS